MEGTELTDKILISAVDVYLPICVESDGDQFGLGLM